MTGISIPILSNVRDFLRGTSDVETALDGVADSLDGLADDARRDAARIGDELGSETRDGARDAERSVERLEGSFRDLSDRARRESSDAGQSISRNVGDGADRARDGVSEIGEEAASTAKETAASFDGSAESIGDAFQEIAANAFAGFGPAGLIAGLAAAAGIGLVFAKIEEGNQNTEQFKESVSELAAEFIDTGEQGVASLDFIIERLKSLATESEDGKVSLADLADVAGEAGSSYKDLADAYSGSADDLDSLLSKNKKYLDALRDEADAVDTTAKGGAEKYSALLNQIDAQERYNGYLTEASEKAQQAAEAEENYAAAGGPAMEAKAEAISTIQDSIDDAAGSWEDYKNEETGAIDPAAFLAAVQARMQASADYATNLEAAQAKLSPEAYQYLIDQGIDFAPMLAAILAGGDDMINNFNSTFTAAAEAGKSAVEGTLPEEFDVTAKVDADTTEAETKTTATEKKDRSTTVKAKADTKEAEAKIDEMVAKTRVAAIGTAADTTGAANTLYNFVNQRRTATITAVVVDRNGKKID
jgi:hypothetical protein